MTALREFGTRSLADVLEPALQLADEGFPMHVGLAGEPAGPDNALAGAAGASLTSNAKRFLTNGRRQRAFICPKAKSRNRAAW